MTRQFGSNVPPDQRRPVAWYAPGVLWQAGRELVQSADFQRNLDRREMFSPGLVPIDLADRTATAQQPFWLDFVSDTGDGGNATFTVAQALLARELRLTGQDGQALVLPEGELLVLGGDLAYPGASAQEYQYRFIEMLAQAQDPQSRFLAGGGAPRKFIAAIPQNHDWFDSASTFCRYFVSYDKGAVIGARTPQRQTWFACRLPQGFWVLGLDFALVGDIDRQQFEGFTDLLDPTRDSGIQPGDNVLLVYPEPYWTRPLGDGAAPGYPRRYQRLEALIEARGAHIRVRLAGDLHHYVRETLARDSLNDRDTHLVTCGCGGAFLHPTHSEDVLAIKHLDRQPEPQAASVDLGLRVRAGRGAAPEASPASRGTAPPNLPQDFVQQVAWPSPDLTRRLAWGNLLALFRPGFSQPPWRLGLQASVLELWNSNVGFALCLGALYGFNAYVNSGVFSASFAADGFGPMGGLPFGDAALLWLKAMVYSPFASFVNVFMLAGCVRIAWEGPGPTAGRLISGLAHGMIHGFLIFVLYWLACSFLKFSLPVAWDLTRLPLPPTLVSTGVALLSWVLVGLLGVLVGGLLFGIYLAVACAGFGQLPNNAFGSLALRDYKGFLRMRLTEDGLTVYLIGIDQVPRRFGAHEPLPAGWRVVDQFHLRR